jgi:hypothetical protein
VRKDKAKRGTETESTATWKRGKTRTLQSTETLKTRRAEPIVIGDGVRGEVGVARDGGAEGAGLDEEDADVEGGELDREGFGYGVHGGLGGAVGSCEASALSGVSFTQ